MKIIHCADLHIDSKMNSHFDEETASRRRAELLADFSRLADYAEQAGAEAVLISGDLFDTGFIKKSTKSVVAGVITSHPQIEFFYLRGNHDTTGFVEELKEAGEFPDNLKLFGTHWSSYELCDEHGSVVITGAELTGEPSFSLMLDGADFNIVMLHGQAAELNLPGKRGENLIPLKAYRDKGIDYFALGHLHSYRQERLDSRGVWCYPGCLEGRGFDEPGQHGFVLLDIDTATHRFTSKFVPFATREIKWIQLDVSGVTNTTELEPALKDILSDCGRDIVRIEFVGNVDVETELDCEYLVSGYSNRAFFLDIRNSTKPAVDYASFLYDATLKGEFVRRVYNLEGVSAEDKVEIIRLGFAALEGRIK